MTGIFYGSTTGTTEAVAQDIARHLDIPAADVHNVATASADETDPYDLLLLGSSTWGCGDLQDIPVIGLVREIEAAIGTEVRSYQLTIHYLCPACRQKEAH